MRCQDDSVTRVPVTAGATALAGLPAKGVLRFERGAGAMAGKPVVALEGGTLVLRYTDGSKVYVKGV